MADLPVRYDIGTDSFVPVTQDWVDTIVKRVIELKDQSHAKQIARAEEDHGRDRARVEAPSEQQSGQNPSEGCQGIRKRGSSKSEAPEAREVAAAYAVTVDGWIEIPHKAIRNPASGHIVWMALATWNSLASHATDRGLFYIPCEPGCQTLEDLRLLVASREISDGS